VVKEEGEKTLMVQLSGTAAAWGTPEFADILKAELEQLDPAALPLQEGLSHGSYVSGERFEIMINGVTDGDDVIRARAGIHYQSIIAGCSCADDPTPVDELSEYCEVEVTLDKASGAAQVALLDE
jgi:hypothetical protein